VLVCSDLIIVSCTLQCVCTQYVVTVATCTYMFCDLPSSRKAAL